MFFFFVVPFFFVGALGSKNSYSIVWEGCFLRFTLVDCYTRPVPCGNPFWGNQYFICRINFLFLAYLGRRLAFGEGMIADGWWHGMVGLISSTVWLTVRSDYVVCTWWDKPHADGLYRFMRMLEFTLFVLSSALALPTSHERGKVDAAEKNDVLAVPVFLLKHDLNIWDRYFMDDLCPKPNTFSPKKTQNWCAFNHCHIISMAEVPKWNPALRPVPHHTEVSKVLEEFMNVSDVIEARKGRVLWPARGVQTSRFWVVKTHKEIAYKAPFSTRDDKRETYIVLLTLLRWNMCPNTQLLSVGLVAVSWNWGALPQNDNMWMFPFHSLSMFPKDIWSLWMIHVICHLKGRATSGGKLTLKVFH